MSSHQEEEMLLAKLDVVKDIRSKTMQLEKMKARIMQQMQSIKAEDDNLRDYKAEIEHLKRERMMHVESLRLIERDITMMESTVHEANQEREKIRERACLLFEEYTPLKMNIDTHRMHIGLDRLSDIPEKELLLTECSAKGTICHQSSSATEVSSQETYSSPLYSHLPPKLPPTFVPVNQLTKYQISRPRRQQQPPMKTCNSCQELIHRNAPVCPMCKAKSKSKNPKKPKRKIDE